MIISSVFRVSGGGFRGLELRLLGLAAQVFYSGTFKVVLAGPIRVAVVCARVSLAHNVTETRHFVSNKVNMGVGMSRHRITL